MEMELLNEKLRIPLRKRVKNNIKFKKNVVRGYFICTSFKQLVDDRIPSMLRTIKLDVIYK